MPKLHRKVAIVTGPSWGVGPAFLAADKAAFITGQTLFVDGGASLRRVA